MFEKVAVKDKNGVVREWKILVIDDASTRILSHGMRMFDLTKHGVTVVERLELRRKPFLRMEAIYIIEPTIESVQKIISDFENPSKPTYKGIIYIYK